MVASWRLPGKGAAVGDAAIRGGGNDTSAATESSRTEGGRRRRENNIRGEEKGGEKRVRERAEVEEVVVGAVGRRGGRGERGELSSRGHTKDLAFHVMSPRLVTDIPFEVIYSSAVDSCRYARYRGTSVRKS